MLKVQGTCIFQSVIYHSTQSQSINCTMRINKIRLAKFTDTADLQVVFVMILVDSCHCSNGLISMTESEDQQWDINRLLPRECPVGLGSIHLSHKLSTSAHASKHPQVCEGNFYPPSCGNLMVQCAQLASAVRTVKIKIKKQ